MAIDDLWPNLVLLADAAMDDYKKTAKRIAGMKRILEILNGESSSSSFSISEGEENPNTKFPRLVSAFGAEDGRNRGDDLARKASIFPGFFTVAKKRRLLRKKRTVWSFSPSPSPPSSSGFDSDSRKRKPRAPRDSRASGDDQRPIPAALREWIAREGGGESVLVLQKQLFATDVNKNNNRLSMPPSELRGRLEGLLGKDEALRLKEKAGLAVGVVDEAYREYKLVLKLWKMSQNVVYNLISRWNSVVENNALREDDVVQLWAFRRGGKDLGFAVVKAGNVASD